MPLRPFTTLLSHPSTNNPSGGESFLEAADKVSSSPLTCKSAIHSHFPHIRITATISDSKNHTLLSRPSCRKNSRITSIGPRWTCLMPVMILPLVAWILTGEIFFFLLANKKGVRPVYETTQSSALLSICTNPNVQQDWAPPNDVDTNSDEIEAITDDFDLSGNIVVSPRTMSTSALTSFEEKSSNAMNRYLYTESPD